MKGIFFDEDEARAVVTRLVQEGWTADLNREPFAGEDDDEDHPWAVTTDAPAIVFEVLVDSHDGWLESDHPAEPVTGLAPLDLPRSPKRIKRPDLRRQEP